MDIQTDAPWGRELKTKPQPTKLEKKGGEEKRKKT